MSVLTLSGNNFTVKADPRPQIWADFEGSINPSNLGVKTTWDDRENLVRVTSDTKFGDSNAMVKGTWLCSTYKSFNFKAYVDHSTATTFVNRRFDFPFTANQKMYRDWIDSGFSESTDFVYSTIQGLNECSNTQSTFFGEPDNWGANAWNSEFFRWTHGPSYSCTGTDDGGGGFYYRLNGSTEINKNNYCNCDTDLGNMILVDNFTDGAHCPADGSNVWMDNLYWDTAYNMVFISTASTWNATTNPQPCIPSAWSNTSVTCRMHLGDIPADSTVYAYLFNDHNLFNGNGQQVTASAGGGGGPGGAFSQPGTAFQSLQFNGSLRIEGK